VARLDIESVTGLHPRAERTYYRLRLSQGVRDRQTLAKSEQWCTAKRGTIQSRLAKGESEETVWREATERESRARRGVRKRGR